MSSYVKYIQVCRVGNSKYESHKDVTVTNCNYANVTDQ